MGQQVRGRRGLNGNTNKLPDEELSSEIVRSAMLVVDFERRLLRIGHRSDFADDEVALKRLIRAVDALRAYRGGLARAKRAKHIHAGMR